MTESVPYGRTHIMYKCTWLGFTGRNIHALDPYRMPSQAALEHGAAAGKGILKAHRDANHGTYPQTVAVSFRHMHILDPDQLMYSCKK